MNKIVEEEIEKKEQVTEPWTPASHLDIPLKLRVYLEEQELKPRWKRFAELDKANLEGWKPLEVTEDIQALLQRTIIDGTQMNSYIRKRELILCVLPYERVKARQKYYDDLQKSSFPTTTEKYVEEIKKTASDEGSGTGLAAYGEVKVGVNTNG